MKSSTDEHKEENLLKPYPVRRAKLADVIWIVLFVALSTAIAIIAVYAFQNCVSSRFYGGVDSWGNVCGGTAWTKTIVNGVNGSGQIKSKYPYLWILGFQTSESKQSLNCLLTSKNSTLVKICVKECPGRLNKTLHSCRKVLSENEYDLEYTDAKCKEMWQSNTCQSYSESNSSDAVILGRCLPPEMLKPTYVVIPWYLSVWHYAIHDVINCADVIAASVFSTTAACVATCILIIKYPKYAFVCCNAMGILVCCLAALGAGLRMFTAKRTVSVSLLDDVLVLYGFCGFCSVLGMLLISVNAWRKWEDARYARGFLSESSKCLQSLPKLLSQPLWTAFGAALGTFFCSMLLGSVLNCYNLQASENMQTVEYSTSKLSHAQTYTSLLVIAFYIWYVNVLPTGQKVVIAGAISLWYFDTEHHLLLHPISSSTRHLFRYNIGSVLGGAFHSKFLYGVFSYFKKSKGNKILPENPIYQEEVPKSLLSLLSPYCPSSVGIYGYARSTYLCNGFTAQQDRINNARLPTSRSSMKKRSRHSLRTEHEGLLTTIRRSHSAARWTIRSCRLSFICASMTILVAMLEVKESAHVRFFPFLLAALVICYACDICLGVMTGAIDTLAICFIEDMSRNNGKDRLYFGSRGLIYHITGLRIPEFATFGGLVRIGKRKKLQEKQRQKDDARKAREADALAKIKTNANNRLFKMEYNLSPQLKKKITVLRERESGVNVTTNHPISHQRSPHRDYGIPVIFEDAVNDKNISNKNEISNDHLENCIDDTKIKDDIKRVASNFTALDNYKTNPKKSDDTFSQESIKESESTVTSLSRISVTDNTFSSFVQTKGNSTLSRNLWRTVNNITPAILTTQNKSIHIIKTIRREEDISDDDDEEILTQDKYETKLWDEMNW